MTSTQTSFAAVRAPARSPWAALLQIPSTFAFTLAESVGSLSMIDLQIATYWATPAMLAGPLAALLGVVAGDVDVFAVVTVVLGAGVEVAAGVLAAVELLVVELLLPHPEMSAPQSSPARSSGDRVPIIWSPLIEKTLARGTVSRPANA
jgi:hypothetical protein